MSRMTGKISVRSVLVVRNCFELTFLSCNPVGTKEYSAPDVQVIGPGGNMVFNVVLM